jgi:hypothetical protein
MGGGWLNSPNLRLLATISSSARMAVLRYSINFITDRWNLAPAPPAAQPLATEFY